MKIIERWFWAFCVAAALIGLFLPVLAAPIAGVIKYLLGGILFFTGLKLDFGAAFRELTRLRMVGYLAVMRLVVLPAVLYGIARLVLPAPLAVGVLIVAAMPSGAACSAMTDILRGNAALALVGTLVTSLLCPVTTPWIIEFCSGQSAAGGLSFLLKQAGFLAIILFVPLGAAVLLRRLFPKPIDGRRDLWSALAMVSLFLLIAGALASVSGDFKDMVKATPGQAAGLFLFMCFVSAFLHTVGYWAAPWRPLADRAALSVNLAYVNNGLAIVFASQFFREIPALGAAAVLPAILMEIPMDMAIVPFKAFIARKLGKVPAAAGPLQVEPGQP